jgi:hypothetical protein
MILTVNAGSLFYRTGRGEGMRVSCDATMSENLR